MYYIYGVSVPSLLIESTDYDIILKFLNNILGGGGGGGGGGIPGYPPSK